MERAKELYRWVSDGLLKSEVPVEDVLRFYDELCRQLGLSTDEWIDHELNGYPNAEEVPEYRKLDYHDVEVKSGLITNCGKDVPTIISPPGQWDGQAKESHLRKCSGLVDGSTITCRRPISWYEYESNNGTGRIRLMEKIDYLPGSHQGFLYSDVSVTTSRQLMRKIRNGVVCRLKTFVEKIDDSYKLSEKEQQPMNIVNNISTGNNSIVTTGNQNKVEKVAMSSAESEKWWAALLKHPVVILILAVILIVPLIALGRFFFFGPGTNNLDKNGISHTSSESTSAK